MNSLATRLICIPLTAALLSACGSIKTKPSAPPMDREMRRQTSIGKLMGEDSLVFGPGAPSQTTNTAAVGMRVNPNLWRATLDTLSFMPIASADANGGVYVTDWYTSDKKTNERIKITVEISSVELRANSLKVRIHKQNLKGGQWVNVNAIESDAQTELENLILTKARKLRMQG